MTVFDVLSQETDIDRHLLVEASAGTGKTFTIEHLFVRRLVTALPDGTYTKVEEMALVTFTRACAQEISERIGLAIQAAIDALESQKNMPSYLLEISLQGERAIYQAKKRLQRAKSALGEAMICTIHGFCDRLLSEYHLGGATFSPSSKRYITRKEIEEYIADYFAAGFDEKEFTVAEYYVLLKEREMGVGKKLIRALQENLWKNEGKAEKGTLREQIYELKQLAKGFSLSPEKLFTKLEEASFHYTGLRDKNGQLKKDVLASFKSFSSLFSETDTDIENLVYHPFFPDELFSTPKVKSAADFQFIQKLQTTFAKKLYEALDPEAIFLRLVESCQKFVTEVMRKKGLFSFQDLLYQTDEALQDTAFRDFLKSRFKAVFVDEFQDTDPIQWRIFSTAFLKPFADEEWRGFLYLVGDPKQAIYAFRNADVYNYVKAKEMMPATSHVVLSTNYRSSNGLCEALNTLFVGPQSRRLFLLPKENRALDMLPVQAGKKEEGVPFFDDGKREIHFFTLKASLGRKRSWPHEEAELKLFSFIASEIDQLASSVLPKEIAVLVKDRFQAGRLQEFLHTRGIESHTLRRESVVASKARELLIRLLATLEAPKNRKVLLHLLAFEPFFFSEEECQLLAAGTEEALFQWAAYVELFMQLRSVFEEKGIASLAESFLAASLTKDAKSVLEQIFSLPDGNGKEVYIDFEHLVDLLIEETKGRKSTLTCLIDYLKELPGMAVDESQEHGRRYEECDAAIQILTMHKSKGLEFDVVFALGLASRTKSDERKSSMEDDAEKMRQLYVACTRAKKRLYLPVLIEEDEKKVARFTASCMELFLAEIALSEKLGIASTDIYEEIGKESVEAALCHLTKSSPHISRSEVLAVEECYFSKELKKEAVDEATSAFAVPIKRLKMESFSSQKRKYERKPLLAEGMEMGMGKEAGTLLHQLIAEFLPESKNIPDTLDWTQKKLAGTLLEKSVEEVYKMLMQLLDLSLRSISLRDVDMNRSFQEMEFVYQESEETLVSGIFDCAFEYEGVSYLIDWKTHALDDYSEEALRSMIKEQNYDLQAKIYITAFKRYLKQFSKPLPFGGLFFVFLRGISEGKGVVFIDA